MEQPPSDENAEQAERREWLVKNLRELGAGNAEVKIALAEWLKTEQEKRNPDYSPEVLGNVLDHGSGIPAEIALGLLYRDARLVTEASEALNFALEDAYNMGGQEKLEAEIEKLIDSLEDFK